MKLYKDKRSRYVVILASVLITSTFVLSSCSSDVSKEQSIVAPSEDNIVETMQEYLSSDEMERIKKGYSRYLSLIQENKYSDVRGVLKAYLDVTNEYDYNQQKIKFADYYATLTQEEKSELFSSYTEKGKFLYYFNGSKYNAFLDNTTVCLGFTDILEDYLIRKGYDVESIIADGYSLVDGDKVKIANHKFLKVKIDTKWYYINPGSDYDGNIDSFKFILTSKNEIKKAFEDVGNIYDWEDRAEAKAISVYPRRRLIKAFLDIRDDEIRKNDGLYLNIDGAIKEYIQDKERFKEIKGKNYLVVDSDFFDILKRTEIFSQFKNLYMDIYYPKVPYRVYQNIFSSFQSADIMFSDKMRKEEVQKIQKAYLETRKIGKKTRVDYPYIMEDLSELEDKALKTLLACDLFKPLQEGKVKYMKHIQVNMRDSRIDDFKEYFKYLYMLESLDFIYINNESHYDIFQIQALRDSKKPIYYSCSNTDINYGQIENKIYLKSTNPNFVELAKSFENKGNVVVINNHQLTDDISYIDEYKTTSLAFAIEQKKFLTKQTEVLDEYIQTTCDEFFKDKLIEGRDDAMDIYKTINSMVDKYLEINIEFKRAYYMAEAFEEINEEGYSRYKNSIVDDIIDQHYLDKNIVVFRNDDIMNIVKDNEGLITITLKGRERYSFSKEEMHRAMNNWSKNDTNYIFDNIVANRIKRELSQVQISN